MSAAQPVGAVQSTMMSANVNYGAGVQVGQLSLGLMAAGLLGLFLFYLWTKGIQR